MLTRLRTAFLLRMGQESVAVIGFLFLNFAFNILANAGFKLSALSKDWRAFIFWQVIGNLSGFITVLTLTALLRYLPLSVAFPLTTGLAILGVQVLAASWYFREPIRPMQWVGTLFIILGIWLIERR